MLPLEGAAFPFTKSPCHQASLASHSARPCSRCRACEAAQRTAGPCLAIYRRASAFSGSPRPLRDRAQPAAAAARVARRCGSVQVGLERNTRTGTDL
ncbi:MAG: hypothetical protein DI621_28610 [Pseudomonas protegens]|nr:MAG: hypothetical protein DI621_28610 [Pseudomonas protegens]